MSRMSASDDDAETLFARLIASQSTESGLGIRVLRAFHRGFPLGRLRELLDSKEPRLVAAGAWLLSEMGSAGRPLRGYLPSLLRNEQVYVRADSIDCATVCTNEEDGDIVVLAAGLLKDDVRAIRWKTTVIFLKAASERALRAGIAATHDAELRTGLEQLLVRDRTVPLLESKSGVLRHFGLASALRYANEVALTSACGSADDEIAEFAGDEIAHRERVATRLRERR